MTGIFQPMCFNCIQNVKPFNEYYSHQTATINYGKTLTSDTSHYPGPVLQQYYLLLSVDVFDLLPPYRNIHHQKQFKIYNPSKKNPPSPTDHSIQLVRCGSTRSDYGLAMWVSHIRYQLYFAASNNTLLQIKQQQCILLFII